MSGRALPIWMGTGVVDLWGEVGGEVRAVPRRSAGSLGRFGTLPAAGLALLARRVTPSTTPLISMVTDSPIR